jgi:tRNA-uridine 2-sulfurtransferase
VIVGEKSHKELFRDSLIALDWHWIGEKYDLPLDVRTKIRYRQEPQEAVLKSLPNPPLIKGGNTGQSMQVIFKETQWAVASGQVVVAYVGDECIGSGIIR